MKTYKVDISIQGVEGIEQIIDKIEEALTNGKFIEFLKNKCEKLLYDICDMNLPIANEPDTQKYMDGMEVIIDENSVILSNNSVIDIEEKNMKETTKAKYPAQLSLAQIVEYGIGYEGQNSPYASQIEDWELDVNKHGSNGWYFKDDAGNIHWTDGFEGKFIFFKLKENIMQNAQLWLDEYIKSVL